MEDLDITKYQNRPHRVDVAGFSLVHYVHLWVRKIQVLELKQNQDKNFRERTRIETKVRQTQIMELKMQTGISIYF